MTRSVLSAAQELAFHLDASPYWRIGWSEEDWWGPVSLRIQRRDSVLIGPGTGLRMIGVDQADASDDLGTYRAIQLRWEGLPLPIRTCVRAYRDLPVLIFVLEADSPMANLATGVFAEPSVSWPFLQPAHRRPNGVPAGTRSYGHQYTEFALPVMSDADCLNYRMAPHRPPVVEPLLLIAPDGRTLMLAPLDQFHEQIIAVPADSTRGADGVRCGWHGDLMNVPAGFRSELAVWAGPSPRAVLAQWGAFLRRRHQTQRLSRYADWGVGKLSYWTDNGAVYYYRTEPGRDYTDTLVSAIEDLHARDIPVASLQIDSWFYPHQIPRPVSAEGAPIVPPSGMTRWEPRADVFPEGFNPLRQRLGSLPFVFHSRHFSSASPYFEHFASWIDGDYGHPADAELAKVMLTQAAEWGAITYEQDWMVESFLGVRGLREAPGRARAWQEALDAAAGENGLSLQWCMASPADFLQSVTLRHLSSIRTSGDYRYLFDNGFNWLWFLLTNALARALGLHAFKDVFVSHGATALTAGEPYADIEALLASLSAGPVAIGDQVGCSNRDVVMRTCREDGVLIKPDVAIAAIDRCFRSNAFVEPQLLVGETFSAHQAGRWLYVVALNAYHGKQVVSGRVDLADLGMERPDGPVIVYDWRHGTWTRLERESGWDVTLEFQDWDFRIVCPLLEGDVTIFGDVSKYATMGDQRLRRIVLHDRILEFDVLASPATIVTIAGYSMHAPQRAVAWSPEGTRVLPRVDGTVSGEGWCWKAGSGEWEIAVAGGVRGWTRVLMELEHR